MDAIEFGIITAPRQVPTLAYSIQSLRSQIDSRLSVFAEPGPLEIDGGRMNIYVNKNKLGALRNYDSALKYLLKISEKPYVCVLEDDYIYNKTLSERLNDIVSYEGEFGYFNLFTNGNNPLLKVMPKGWQDMRLGWHDAWGVAYVFKREIAERILKHEYYLEAFSRTDKNIDSVISETLLRMNLPMFYHNPSPSCTFGIISTLGHACLTDGLNFKI